MKEIDERIGKKMQIEKEIEREEEDIGKLLAARAYQVAKIIRELPKPKGLFRKECPKCGEQLFGGRLNSRYKYFVCTHCFYDYSKPVRFSPLNSLKALLHPAYSKEALKIVLERKEVISTKELCHRLAEFKRKIQLSSQ